MAYNHLLADGSPITAPHIQAQYYLPIVDRTLELQTVVHFVEFAFGGPLPNGTRPSSLDTLLDDEVDFFQGSESNESVMGKIMVSLGSEEDSSRLTMVGKNIHSLKSRLWEGITPLSDQRWEEEGLHLDENFDQACQHLSAAVAVFEYLNAAEVQESLRETFNLIYAHWEGLDAEINRKRRRNGEGHISMAGLWTTYMESRYKVMTHRAHQWVTRHVDELRAPIFQGLLDHESDFEGLMVPDDVQWKLTNALHMLLEISIRADYMVMMPMEGYNGYTPLDRTDTDPYGMYSANYTERGQAYPQRMKSLSHQLSFNKIFSRIDSGTERPEQTSGEEYHESAMEQVEAQIAVRKELRGEDWDEELQEPWITRRLAFINNEDNASPSDAGFVIYRLTYGQSEREWTNFIQELGEHMSDWGTGQTGSDSIKPYLKLHWIDGKELGFAEGDIDAAKEHFNQNFNNNNGDNSKTKTIDLQRTAFLAINPASFTSYTNPNTTNPPINSTTHPHDHSIPRSTHPFLLAIDPNFDPAEGPYRPDETPGYTGEMRITGSLIWGDLFAILDTQSATLEELWPLAMHHPEQVYVGPVIPLQLCAWGAESPIAWWLLVEVFWEVVNSLLGELKGWRGMIVLVVLGAGGYWFTRWFTRWLRRGGRWFSVTLQY
ncbi:hypothetical protein BJX99DRAFT_86635 [Aspergillus californicus]